MKHITTVKATATCLQKFNISFELTFSYLTEGQEMV